MNNQIFVYTPSISLHKYRTVYENNILFRKPPLLGPPLSLPDMRITGGRQARDLRSPGLPKSEQEERLCSRENICMYVCMYVCMYIYIYVYIYVYVYIYIYIYTHTYVHI